MSEDEATDIRPALHAEGSPRRRLLLFWGNNHSIVVDAPRSGAIVIGRSGKCDISIDDASISRQHAVIHAGAQLRIEDLGSSNGTWVGSVRLEAGQSAPFGQGVLVTLGSVLLVLQAGRDVAATPGAVADEATRAVDVELGAGVVVADPRMTRLYELVTHVARSTISVVLLGETGVGKEVVADTLHRNSARAKGPFVRLNCAALPEALLESELFGYERGAFTGAVQSKSGLLEAGHEGTVFLDEIGDMPMATQTKVLRAIESRELMRLGGLKPRPIDVRFVSATHRDLDALVASGSFREDLYFRLNGIALAIPPLRERPSEIPLLARAFAAKACRDAGRPVVELAADALGALGRHPWPGNVRELRNVIERAVVLCREGPIGKELITLGPLSERASLPARAADPNQPRAAPSVGTLPGEIADLEKRRIVEALQTAAGNQTEAAKLLGISRRTLLHRLDAFGLPRPRLRGSHS